MGCGCSRERDEPMPKKKLPATVTPTRTKFETGKEVVAEIPHKEGPPMSEFRGMKGTVQKTDMTPEGRVYEVLFDMTRQVQMGTAVVVNGRGGKIVYGPDEDQEYIVRFDDSGVFSDCLKKEDFVFPAGGDDTRCVTLPAEYVRTAGALANSTNVDYLTIDQLLRACKSHSLPVFQRRYCWTERQCSRLWQSIASMQDAGTNVNNHSIGRLMLLEQAGGTRLVLDGQQRLTTLTMALVALRDRLSALGEEKAAADLDGLCTGRLVPTLDDRPDFEECLAQPQPEGEGALLKAKRVFAGLSEALDAQGCKDMAKTARRRLSALAFVLEDERGMQRVYENLAKRVVTLEEARRMGVDLSTCNECFTEDKQTPSMYWGPGAERLCEDHAKAIGLENCESMTPGVEMSPVDLVRNFVIEHYEGEPAMRRAHAEYWSPLEAKAGGTADGLEQLLKHFLADKGFKVKHRWSLYTDFIVWWRIDDGDVQSAEAKATAKLEELLAACTSK